MSKTKSLAIQAQFSQVLEQIQTAKRQAYQQLNNGLVGLYWNIGNYISKQVKNNHWGKSVVEELAVFIKNQEPDVKGFTARNMWMMKQFYELYQHDIKLHTLCAQLSWSQNRRIMKPNSFPLNEFYALLDNKNK